MNTLNLFCAHLFVYSLVHTCMYLSICLLMCLFVLFMYNLLYLNLFNFIWFWSLFQLLLLFILLFSMHPVAPDPPVFDNYDNGSVISVQPPATVSLACPGRRRQTSSYNLLAQGRWAHPIRDACSDQCRFFRPFRWEVTSLVSMEVF